MGEFKNNIKEILIKLKLSNNKFKLIQRGVRDRTDIDVYRCTKSKAIILSKQTLI